MAVTVMLWKPSTRRKSLTWDNPEGSLLTVQVNRYEGGVNVVQASVRNVGTLLTDDKGKMSSGRTVRMKVLMQRTGAEPLVVVMKLHNGSGAKGFVLSSFFKRGQPKGRSQ